MKNYTYYPGCSIQTSSKHYEESLLPVLKELGVELEEMEDWNCCGATASLSVDETASATINARNLSIAEKSGKDILAPCAACYLSLKKANQFLKEESEKATALLEELKKNGIEYTGKVQIKHPLEVLSQELGLDALKEKVQRKLTGLNVASYYGCQVVRPYLEFDDPDYPHSMDDLMSALGATPVDYAAKTRCCGGSLTANLEEPGARLNYILLKEAQRKNADVIVTLCPLCHFNLETTQKKIAKKYKQDFNIPILFFSQLMGLALGIPKKKLGFSRSLIPLKAMWEKLENGGTNE